MNKKKIFTFILASVIFSNVLTQPTVLAVDIYSKPNANLPADTNKALNIPNDGTPLVLGLKNNSALCKPVKPIIKIDNSFLDENYITVNKLVHATLNGKPYNLKFISKDNSIVTLEGDILSSSTAETGKNELIIYAPDKTNPFNDQLDKVTKIDFLMDLISPNISFSEINKRDIENGKCYTGEVNPAINLSDNYHIASYSISLNGKPCQGHFKKSDDKNMSFVINKLSQDGNYNLKAVVTDDAGNTTTLNKSFIIDNTAPSINISGVNDGDYLNSSAVTPYINIQDPNFDATKTSLIVRKNGVEIPVDIIRNGDGLFYFNVYDEGSYSFEVTAYDKAGNVSTSKPINFVIDRTAPILNFNFSDNEYFNKAFKPIIKTENSDDFIDKLTINGIEYSPNNLPDFLENNAYEVIAIAKDKAGNFSPVSHLKFTIDTIVPVINISNLTDNYYYNISVNPSIISTDVNPDLFTMTLNGINYNNEAISAEGNYKLVILSTDKAKNSTSKIINFVIDKTSPIISLKGLVNNEIFNHGINPYIYITDSNSYMSILMLDGEDYHGGIIGMDGKHTLLIEAVDKAGNLKKEAINFFIKAEPPQIYVSDIDNGKTYTGSVTPKISFSKDAVESETTMTLDGNPYKLNDKISSVGNHELVISTKDSVGNKSTKRVNFSIASDKKPVTTNLSNAIKKIIPTSNSSSSNAVLCGIAAIIAGAAIALFLRLKLKAKKVIKK